MPFKKNLIWGIISLAILAAVTYVLFRHIHLVTDIIVRSGPLAPIVAIILYPLLAPTPITTDPITIIMSVTYSPLMGIAVGTIGNTLSALFEYYLGEHIGKRTSFGKEKMPFGLGKLPINSPFFLLFGRMIPGYGSKVISLLAGEYRVPLKMYIWTSIATSFLGSAVLSLGGWGVIKVLLTGLRHRL